MKILIATRETQGKRENDFFWTDDNEIVMDSFECETDKTVDGHCGCRRSLVGIDTKKATTTFKVAESELTKSDITNLFTKSLQESFSFDGLESEAKESANLILRTARKFEVGAVLEKRGRKFQKRK